MARAGGGRASVIDDPAPRRPARAMAPGASLHVLVPFGRNPMNMREAMRLERQGRLQEAEAECRRALRHSVQDADAWEMLGVLAGRRGAADEAVVAMQRAVALAPGVAEFHINLSAALGAAGRPAEAIPHLAAALRTRGNLPEVHNNLGVTFEKLNRLAEAVAAYDNAIALRSDYTEAHYNRGQALRKLGRARDAMAAYRQVLKLRPGHLRAANVLAGLAADSGDARETATCYRSVLQRNGEYAPARSAMLYTLHYDPRYGAEELFREHLEWGRRHCEPLRPRTAPHQNDRRPDRRLRVGYVSPDLREHTVTKFITAAIEHHDPGAPGFELFCYSDAEVQDRVTTKLKGMVEHWHETRKLSDSQLEQLIRQDGIDVLVDLRGHAADNRLTLFARKPAPIQVNMVGYFNTTGLATMDYRITDEQQDPPGMTERYHTEQLVRLPNSCWCYTADEDAPDVAEPPVLKNGYVTFGSLNKIVKVSEPCAKLWAQVLEAVPRSRLLLSVAQPPSAVSEDSQPGAAVPQRLSQMGLPVDRVDLIGKTATHREYLERFNRIDIALDTFPFNGITTTCDGLWQGVPCVSLAGDTSVSRAGRSILHAANLPELATDTPEAFVRIACVLARDLGRLRELRAAMRQRLAASPLMDHRRFARDLDSAYRQMWRVWCAGG